MNDQTHQGLQRVSGAYKWHLAVITRLSLVGACSAERKATGAPSAPARDSLAATSAAAPARAKHIATVHGLQTPESARWDSELNVWFVSNINGSGLARDGNGYISRLRSDGTKDALKFVSSGRDGVTLDAPKGLAIVGDTLWVADIHVVRGFNRKSGTPISDINVPGAQLLNDIAVGPDGIYITDTGVELATDGRIIHPGPDRVFRIAGRTVTTAVIFSGQPGPNGITWDSAGSRFLMVPYFDSTIVAWELGDSSAIPFATGPALMDGVEALGEGRYLVSAGADSSLNLIEKNRVTRVAGDLPNPDDIGFDRASGRVAVPLVMDDRMELFELPANAP